MGSHLGKGTEVWETYQVPAGGVGGERELVRLEGPQGPDPQGHCADPILKARESRRWGT